MKFLILGDSIVLYGINRRMELQLFLSMLPVVFLGYIFFPILLLFSRMFIVKAASCVALITLSALLIGLMLSIRKAYNSQTIIDKSNHKISFVTFGKTEEHYKGDFKYILFDAIGSYRGVICYKAYLICTDGDIELGIVARTKRGLRIKLKPVIDYLGLPIQEA